jgi:hypothetical protein
MPIEVNGMAMGHWRFVNGPSGYLNLFLFFLFYFIGPWLIRLRYPAVIVKKVTDVTVSRCLSTNAVWYYPSLILASSVVPFIQAPV